jgi:hypothetical protein
VTKKAELALLFSFCVPEAKRYGGVYLNQFKPNEEKQ